MTDRAAIPLHPVAREIAESQGGLKSYPPVERWDNWEEYDPVAWPQKVKRHYSLIPTICFNCEAGCGLLAYVDRETLAIQKFEGNPAHPGSRGRNCAKGPATLNQVTDPERIRYPLRRVGPRGGGRWERVTWDEVLDDIGGRIRKALVEGRQREVMYHLGRPGHELVYLQRVFHAWGIDGHNSHTNVCSASARAGYAFWHGMDRPSPDHANARFILLLSCTWRPATTSTRTPSESWKPSRAAPRSPCSTRGSVTPRRWPTGGWRRGRGRSPPCSWRWRISWCARSSTTASSSAAG